MKGKKLIRQGERIPVRLSFSERNLLFELTFAEPALIDRLRLSLLDKDEIVAKFSLDELNSLLESISAVANHTADSGLEMDLDRLFDHLIRICNSYVEK